MVEQFTRWQTEVNSYRTALENYHDMNNVKIGPPWEPGWNWHAALSLAQLTVIHAMNENIRTLKQLADALGVYYLAKN